MWWLLTDLIEQVILIFVVLSVFTLFVIYLTEGICKLIRYFMDKHTKRPHK